jgi:AbrB family looped-hinge helix DNA binding protein
MAEGSAFYGSATVGAKGQIVIPAEAREAMQIEPGNKVVVVKGPREGSIIVFRVDSFEGLMAKIEERKNEAPAD